MNVISNRLIDKFVARSSAYAKRQGVRTWLLRVLPKRVRRLEGATERVIGEQRLLDELGRVSKKTKDRILEHYRAGDVFHAFLPHHPEAMAFESEVREVVDWLDSVPEWDRHLRRIDRMSYLDALQLSNSWHERLLVLAADADDPDVVEEIEPVMEFSDGTTLVELKGPVALLREGLLMGHCVGGRGYVDDVLHNQCRILSLRDAANRPHATMEVRRGIAIQIKGKGNSVPVERWAEPMREAILALGFGVRWDGNRIGLVSLGGRTVGHPDDVVDLLAADETTFTKSFAGPAGTFLRNRHEALSLDRRMILLDLVSRSDAVRSETPVVLVAGPDGKHIGRWRHEVRCNLLEFMAVGMFSGVEDAAAERAGALVDSILERMLRDPSDVHEVVMPGDEGAFERLAGFAGRFPRLVEVRDIVGTRRARMVDEITVAVRRAVAPSNHNRDRDGSWAQTLAHLRTVSPEALASSRARTSGVVF